MIATAKLQISSSKFTKQENGENPKYSKPKKEEKRRRGGGERKRERERERAKAEEALHLLHRQTPLTSL
jgi:hypothetical protein